MSTPDFHFPVNLDTLTTDPRELWDWGQILDYERPVPDLCPSVRKALADYARTRARAIQARLAGDLTRAGDYERVCRRLYASLPQQYQW